MPEPGPIGAIPSSLMAQAARAYAGRVALRYGEQSWTFAEFDAAADRLASGLARRVAPGERVIMLMANRPEYVVLQCAIERAGLVRVPVNARSTAHELGVILADCEPSVLFYDRTTADRVTAANGVEGLLRVQVDGDAANGGPSYSELGTEAVDRSCLDRATLDDLNSINYTSGTSGRPKGAMLTHRNWAAVYRNMLIDRNIHGDDVLAHIGPLTHASGTYFVPWFLRGATSVIVEGGAIDGLLAAIPKHRVTVFTCVPTALTRIVNHPELNRFDLSSLRMIGYGAEPIPRNTLEKALRKFGPILVNNYGQTEAMMTVSNLPAADLFVPPSLAVDRACCSGMTAVGLGFKDIKVGAADTVICGGFESLSRTPLLMPRTRDRALGELVLDDPLLLRAPDFIGGSISSYTADEALKHGIDRPAQDAWAVESHRRYFAADGEGYFDFERTPIRVPNGKSGDRVVDKDESPRRDTSVEKLAVLKTVRGSKTITPGNAPGLNDGAAALILLSGKKARELSVPVLAHIRGYAQVSEGPTSGSYTPAIAIERLLKSHDLTADRLDLIEINEAFAATVLVSTLRLAGRASADAEKLRLRTNPHGGAVAIGHPLGASGARLVMTLINGLRRRGGGIGVAAICGGFGQGDSVLLEVRD